MDAPMKTKSNLIFHIACIGSGAVVASFLVRKGQYFFENMAFLWLPQAGILLCMWLLGAHLTAISGTALVLSLYLTVFEAHMFHNPGPDSALAWLGYLFSLPGAGIGALVGTAIIKSRKIHKTTVASMVAVISTLIGLAINQTAICNTVLYCGL